MQFGEILNFGCCCESSFAPRHVGTTCSKHLNLPVGWRYEELLEGDEPRLVSGISHDCTCSGPELHPQLHWTLLPFLPRLIRSLRSCDLCTPCCSIPPSDAPGSPSGWAAAYSRTSVQCILSIGLSQMERRTGSYLRYGTQKPPVRRISMRLFIQLCFSHHRSDRL